MSNLIKSRNSTTIQLHDPGQVTSPHCTSVASSVKWEHGTVVKIKWVNPAPNTQALRVSYLWASAQSGHGEERSPICVNGPLNCLLRSF